MVFRVYLENAGDHQSLYVFGARSSAQADHLARRFVKEQGFAGVRVRKIKLVSVQDSRIEPSVSWNLSSCA